MNYKKYPKRDPIRDYFPMPNEIYSLGLSAGEIAIYGFLMYCEDRSTYQCHPSYRTIGRAVKLSNNTVRKYVKDLEEKCLIRTQPTEIIRSDGRRQNGNLLYTIRPIEEASRHRFEVQVRHNKHFIRQEQIRIQLGKPKHRNVQSSP